MENNKEYVLIKKLPFENSPEVGYVLTPSLGNGKLNDYYVISNHINPELYPEYWKLIEQSTFQIISIISPDGYVSKGKEVTYGYMYNAYPDYKIHSVKRLSDGEIFTIGDKILSFRNRKRVINNFLIRGEAMLMCYNLGFSNIAHKKVFEIIKKLKEPVLKTEDGVDIYEGDEYTFIWIKKCARGQSLNTPYTFKAKKSDGDSDWDVVNAKFFSTKEKAEEYIKMDKPEYSRNQIINLLNIFNVYKGEQVETLLNSIK